MSDIDDRARSAGTALRRWMPDDPTPSPTAAARRAVHRIRIHRAAAGSLLVAVLGGVGLLWGPSRGGDDVRIGPATTGSTEDTTPTTGAPDPTTSTTAEAPDAPDQGTGVATSAPPATSTTPPTTEAPATPAPAPCAGRVAGTGITFEVSLPTGWYGNEAALGEPACHHFGPDPIELRPVETEAGTGVGSNAVVQLYVSQGPGGLPTSFDEVVEGEATRATSSRRTTIDGRAAARFERLTGPGDDVPAGGEPYVHWKIDLGEVWFDAVTLLEPGVSYEEAATAIDRIVESLAFSS